MYTVRQQALLEQWRGEEAAAQMLGWDFSHIRGRYTEETDIPWDYETIVKAYLRADMRLLDMDTAAGELLLRFGHPCPLTAATENYPPNVALCKKKLLPLGIDFRAANANRRLPFDDGSFDLVINRHGAYKANELARVLKPGGLFITQQVGQYNDRELITLLLPDQPLAFPGHDLSHNVQTFTELGFTVLQQKECLRPISFYDVGALVWFARILPWEFPGFSVEKCAPQLFAAQSLLERDGKISGQIHRFLLVARNAG